MLRVITKTPNLVTLTRHDKVDHSPMVPGETLRPAQLWLWILDTEYMSAATMWVPDQALQVPGFCVLSVNVVTSPPASSGHVLGEAHQALAFQQFKLQEVAPSSQPVLALLHVHNALQLVSPEIQRTARVSRGCVVKACRLSCQILVLTLLCHCLAVEAHTRYTAALRLPPSSSNEDDFQGLL